MSGRERLDPCLPVRTQTRMDIGVDRQRRAVAKMRQDPIKDAPGVRQQWDITIGERREAEKGIEVLSVLDPP